jgi:hypothetical protein
MRVIGSIGDVDNWKGGRNMLLTRIVQTVFIAGVGSITVLGVRALIQDLRAHRTIRLSEIPVDYNGDIRRKMEKR